MNSPTTEEHLDAWLFANYVWADKREEVGNQIRAFLDEYPNVIDRGDSWPEILEMAGRRRYAV